MATHGIVSVIKDGVVILKVIAGCNGWLASKLANQLKLAGNFDDLESIFKMALAIEFGSLETLVVMNAVTTFFSVNHSEEPSPLYRKTFYNPRFNPRWESGMVEDDCLAIFDINEGVSTIRTVKKLFCRDGGDSFHVGIAIDEDGEETENLSHKDIEEGYLEERGDSELGWVIEPAESGIAFRTLVFDGLCDIQTTKISVETALQLADAFTKAAQRARAAQATRATIIELDTILRVITSVNPISFNDFCSALKRNCPAKEDKAGWRGLFGKLREAETSGLVVISRDEDNKIINLLLSAKGAELIKAQLDEERPLWGLIDQP
jgi:hypothetical protein